MKTSIITIFTILLIACEGSDDMDWTDLEFVTNVPVVTNVPNAFTYIVAARELEDELIADLNFETTSLVVTLTVANRSDGTFLLEIFENDSTIGYQRALESNTVITEFPEFKPSKVHLNMTGFTGNVELTLTAD